MVTSCEKTKDSLSNNEGSVFADIMADPRHVEFFYLPQVQEGDWPKRLEECLRPQTRQRERHLDGAGDLLR